MKGNLNFVNFMEKGKNMIQMEILYMMENFVPPFIKVLEKNIYLMVIMKGILVMVNTMEKELYMIKMEK